MAFRIEDFWLSRLRGVKRAISQPNLPGWSVEMSPNPSFVEADLHVRDDLGEMESPVWFIAAPGAVGKSTLAKEISARAGAIYLDLAAAETVAGNYLTGGLVKSGLLPAWQANETTVLVDALDEARLRVTQKSFDDFLSDVAQASQGRPFPTILFGRVAIVDEAWLILADKGLACPVFDIDFFDPPRAKLFIEAALERISLKSGNEAFLSAFGSHRSVYNSAAAAFVQGLQDVTASDGARFSGYAPVLEAVATVLSGVPNPSSLGSVVEEVLRGQVLQHIADRILAREATKLREQLPIEIPESTRALLYQPEEQLARLTSTIYGVGGNLALPAMRPSHAAIYDSAVSAFMPQHPFLDGSGREASGAVFGAVLNAHALFSSSREMVSAAESHAGDGPYTPNPFLIDFYVSRTPRKEDEEMFVPPEHVAILYESVRARATAREKVQLAVEGDEQEEFADVEIHVSNGDGEKAPRQLGFRTSQAGSLRFGRQVSSVHVDAPQIDMVIGSGGPVEIIAPVSINVAGLSFNCPELVVSASDSGADGEGASVMLEAAKLVDSKIQRVPVVRVGASLTVAWPGANTYPWVQFATVVEESESEQMHEALLRLRKLVISFRSHSKGQLARYKGKVEHARMTKGALGVAIREKLLEDRILSTDGPMYLLDPKALGRVVGATFQDLNVKRFSPQVREYVSQVLG